VTWNRQPALVALTFETLMMKAVFHWLGATNILV